MDRETIDQLWQTAMRQSIEDGEQFTRYHFAKLVAEHVIKDAPDYEMGYADGVAVKRELLEALEKIAGFTLSQFMGPNDMALECINTARAAIRARGNT